MNASSTFARIYGFSRPLFFSSQADTTIALPSPILAATRARLLPRTSAERRSVKSPSFLSG